MDVATIDYWANNRSSPLHRASAVGKLVAVALIIAAVVASFDFLVLLTIYLAVAAAIVSTRLPAVRILTIAAYPGLFAVLFAISRWDGSLLTPAVIVLKALAAAVAMLMMITTTPYPDVFAALQGFLPRVVADGLFLTYRSLFILLELSGELWTALRLRGGLARGHYVRNTQNVGAGLGLLLLRALALSQRLYDVMRLRGYNGRLAMNTRWRQVSPYDLFPLALGAVLLAFALSMRFAPETVAPYNGYSLLLALLGLLVAIVYARRPGRVQGYRR